MFVSALTEHLVVGDRAITVNVVKLESPSELLVEPSSRCDTECTDEFLEVDGSVLVLVKDAEDVFCECRRITEGEKLLVDTAKLLLVKNTRGTILQEALVPLLQLLPVDYRVQRRPGRTSNPKTGEDANPRVSLYRSR